MRGFFSRYAPQPGKETKSITQYHNDMEQLATEDVGREVGDSVMQHLRTVIECGKEFESLYSAQMLELHSLAERRKAAMGQFIKSFEVTGPASQAFAQNFIPLVKSAANGEYMPSDTASVAFKGLYRTKHGELQAFAKHVEEQLQSKLDGYRPCNANAM